MGVLEFVFSPVSAAGVKVKPAGVYFGGFFFGVAL